MWVWVPRTAVTRPSRYQPSATFSLVASAWMSSRMTLAVTLGTSSWALRKGSWQAALKIQDGVALSVGKRSLVDAEAWGSDGVVGGAQDAAAALVGVGGNRHVVKDLALVPDVVSGGNDVRAEVEELFGERRREAETAGGVL